LRRAGYAKRNSVRDPTRAERLGVKPLLGEVVIVFRLKIISNIWWHLFLVFHSSNIDDMYGNAYCYQDQYGSDDEIIDYKNS